MNNNISAEQEELEKIRNDKNLTFEQRQMKEQTFWLAEIAIALKRI